MIKRIFFVFSLVVLLSGPAQAFALNEERALQFLEQCHNVPDRQPNLRYIYWKFKVWEAAEKEFDITPYAPYVRSLQNEDGGFGLWPRDVSTAEGTLAALTILQKAKVKVLDRSACIKYLNLCLKIKAKAARQYSDLVIERDIHSCLIGLSLLGSRVPKLNRYLKILEQDGKPWGIYYRLTAAKAFGRPLKDREEWIKKLDDIATEHLRYRWETEDRHYALEAMYLLGSQFSYGHWIRANTYEPHYRPWRGSGLLGFISVWRSTRMAKLLGLQAPWLESWLEESGSIKPQPVGGYAVMPGMETSPWASFLACRLLRDRGIIRTVPELTKKWEDKQQEAGYYESSSRKLSYPRFTEIDRLVRRINETWQALSALEVAGTAPADCKALVRWLTEVLDKHRDELSSQNILHLLECLEMVGERTENPTEFIKYFKDRFGSDSQATIKALAIMGLKPKLSGAGERLSLLLDRVRVLNIPVELSVLAKTFAALDAIGEYYSGTEYFTKLLGRLQNPDGGLSQTDSPHSNINDTIAALQMVKLLPVLNARYESRRQSNLLIRAQKTTQPVVIDGKLSEWDSAVRVEFAERSERPDKDRNTTVAYAMWDDHFLYLAFRVKDTNLQARIQQGEAKVHRDDSIEFLIDPNLDRTRIYMPDDICVHINLYSTVMDDRGTLDGRYDFSWNSNLQCAFAFQGSLNDSSDQDVGYTAEVAFPWMDLGWKPGKSGHRVGIDLCVNDRDKEEDGYRYSDWANARKFHVPCDWGEIEFVPAQP